MFNIQPKSGVSQPIITKSIVTDIDVSDAGAFVADPLIIKNGDTYYLFFETYTGSQAKLSYATSPDLLNWTYGSKLTLNSSDWNTSYPFVFNADGYWYLIHNDDTTINLYRPAPFPNNWELIKTIWTDETITMRDVSIFQYNGVWYCTAYDATNKNCRLYYGDTLFWSDWSEHPSSPILTGAESSRPGGRPIVRDGIGVDIINQIGVPYYAYGTKIFRLSNLTKITVTVTELETSPLTVPSGVGWNGDGMHHVDRINESFTMVDGMDASGVYSIGLYEDT